MSDLEEPTPDVQSLISVLILQMQRVYDVLLTILGSQNAEASYNLIEVHKNLENIGPVPYNLNENTDE
jgi:phosphotransferase system HPr-like phosphotransfer protein